MRRFTILKGWKISIVQSKKHSGWSCINTKTKQAIIYDVKPRPADFLLHEYLHIALQVLVEMDKRKIKEYLLTEEKLIREICYTIKESVRKSG